MTKLAVIPNVKDGSVADNPAVTKRISLKPILYMLLISLFLPAISGGMWGIMAFVVSFYYPIFAGLMSIFLILANPMLICTLVGIYNGKIWAVSTGMLTVAAMVGWGILAHGYTSGGLVGPSSGPLGVGYYVWIICGILSLLLSFRILSSPTQLVKSKLFWFCLLLSIGFPIRYSIAGFEPLWESQASPVEKLMLSLRYHENELITGLPITEKADAHETIQWLEINAHKLTKIDADGCDYAINHGLSDISTPQPIRSQRVVLQLKNIINKYRH